MAEAILSTKLHPPKLPRGWIPRERPAKRLEEGSRGLLTLVSAPAGYGKSTCVAAWLGSRDEPSAWLSLDPGDSDPGEFARYAIAAVRTLFPEACPETQALLEAPELPPVSALARSLANELDAIESPFVLVLDDYQAVGDRAVHDLLSELLAHPPPCLHLILITRRDPPLPLVSLRARGQLVEVSLQDLQFGPSESRRFLMESTGLSLSDRALAHLEEALEGWPVGLRLVSLALADQADPDGFLCNLAGPTLNVEEYLVQEVLARVPADRERWMLKTAILDRFSASLCEAVCTEEGESLPGGFDGEAFVDYLQARGLFAIGLDQQGRWYRYHHTFKALLEDLLSSRCSAAEVAVLHARAARWFQKNDLPGEAIQHALAAGDLSLARELVRSGRTALVNMEQWSRLDRWLARLPESIVAEDPALLAAMAWSCEAQHRSCAVDHLRKAEKLIVLQPRDDPEREEIASELAALRALHEYDRGHPEEALIDAQRAIDGLSPNALGIRAYCEIVAALSRQSLGDLEGSLGALHSEIEAHSVDETYRSLLLTGVSFVHWQAGDLGPMALSARENLRLGEKLGLPASVAYARYNLGTLHYMRDEQVESDQSLQAVLDLEYLAPSALHYHAAFALASLRLGRGQIEEAESLLESTSKRALESSNARALELVQAFDAELAVRTGRTENALRWAETCFPWPASEIYMFYFPRLTLAKIRLAEACGESRRAAAELLDRLLGWPAAAHNVPLRIQALSLRALVCAADGDEPAALDALTQALALAAPGGFVRPFADLGAPLAALLDRLPGAVAESELVGRIRAASGAQRPAGDSGPGPGAVLSDGADALVEALTNREQDVLELLTQRLRDKEIADKLFIAPVTVKSHLKTLYRKLGVGGRREAVARARELGILAGG